MFLLPADSADSADRADVVYTETRLERSGQRNAGDHTCGPHPPLTNPPAAGGAGGAGGLFTHTLGKVSPVTVRVLVT